MAELVTCYPVPPWSGGVWPHPSRWGWREWDWWLQGAGYGAETREAYRVARDYWGVGLPVRDKRGKATGETQWWYRPTPKQVLFHQAREPFVLYGGARGGAKSHALRWEAYRRCLTTPNYTAILFRRMLTELELYHIRRAEREIPQLTGGLGKVVNGEGRFPNGSLLIFGHAKDEGDEDKYLGAEFDFIGFDQWEQFTNRQTRSILASGRSAGEGVDSVVRGTANPGGVDPQHLIDLFMDHVGLEDMEGYAAAEWLYIPSRVYDNPYLMDPDGTFTNYVRKRLAMYDPIRRRQMLEGDWRAREGAFFPEFSEATHVRAWEAPAGATWFRSLDYGFNRPGCVGWYAFLPDGRLLKRKDFKFQGMNLFAPQGAPREAQVRTVAYHIHRIDRELGVPPGVRLIVDPDLDAKKGGESGVEGLRRAKLRAVPGDNNRYLGWIRTRHWLAPAPDGDPWLVFHPDCKYSIRTFPAVQADKHNPEDVDTEGEDHAVDETRYGLMSRPTPDGQQPASTKHAKGTVGWWMTQARRDARTRAGHTA